MFNIEGYPKNTLRHYSVTYIILLYMVTIKGGKERREEESREDGGP